MVSRPQREHLTAVSILADAGTVPGGICATCLALHCRQRFGSLVRSFCRKNACSPAVKINSLPQSTHCNGLSSNSIDDVSRVTQFPHSGGRETRRLRAHECAGSFIPSWNCRTTRGRSALAAKVDGGLKLAYRLFSLRSPKRNWPKKEAGPRLRMRPANAYSCSLRAFFRLRLRANASFTRFFSPGFK